MKISSLLRKRFTLHASRYTLFILLLISHFSLPTSLYAEEKTVLLEEIIVTASRYEEDTVKIPSHITVITAQDIAATTAQTVPDVLRDVTGVQVGDWVGNGRTSTIDLRGFGETGPLNTLVLVDGRRVNEIDLSGVDWTQIPLERIERIEIIRSSGSVLYGDNAVGGVINIITKKGEGRPTLTVQGHYASYQNHKELIGINGKSGPVSYYLGGSVHELDGYRTNSSFRNKTAGLRLSYDMREWITLDFMTGIKEDKYGMPGSLSQSDLTGNYSRKDSKYSNDWAETEEYYVHLTPQLDFGKWGNLKIGLSSKEKSSYSNWVSWNWIADTKIKTIGILPQYTLTANLGGRINTITFGYDHYEHDLKNKINADHFKKKTGGYYIKDTLAVIPDLLFATVGYRHERAEYNFNTTTLVDKVIHSEDAFNTGLTLAYKKNSKVFFSFNKAFRLPATDEYYSVWTGLNRNLMPQKTKHYDIGIQHAFSDWFSAGMTIFRIDTVDEIFYDPLTFINTNYPETRRDGIEADFRAHLTKWVTLFGSYTYVDSELRTGPYDGKKIPGVASNRVSGGAQFRFLKHWDLNVRGRWVGSHFAISDWNNEGKKQGSYTTLDIMSNFKWRGLKVFAGVNNVFNEKYSEYVVYSNTNKELNFYPSPERNFIGGISFERSF